jgi:hypothetical protein
MAATFGTLRENLYQSDYLVRKTAEQIYCNNRHNNCYNNRSPNYQRKYLYNLGQYAQSVRSCNIIPINKTNLIVGQYAQMNLNGVCTVIPGAPCSNSCEACVNKTPVELKPSSTTPFYLSNTIDPLGQLFGNTQCGELNYTRYMRFYPPAGPLNSS